MISPDRRLLVLAMAAAGLVGCLSGNGSETGADDPSGQLALWQSRKPDGYAYTLSRSCYCPRSYMGPFLVEAEGDSVARVRRIEGHDTLDVNADLQGYSIQAVFETVAEWIGMRNFREDVAYHPDYGFPVSAAFDGSERGADDELHISVTDFRRK